MWVADVCPFGIKFFVSLNLAVFYKNVYSEVLSYVQTSLPPLCRKFSVAGCRSFLENRALLFPTAVQQET